MNLKTTNYGFYDHVTDNQEVSFKKLNNIGYAIIRNATVVLGSEFVFKDHIAYKQDYDFSYQIKDVNYANFRGSITNNNTHLFTKKSEPKNLHLQRAIFLSGSYDYNWYHWLIEILPKLEVLKFNDFDFSKTKILISEKNYNSANHLDALRFHTTRDKLVVLNPKTSYKIDEVIHIDSPSINLPNKKFDNKLFELGSGNFQSEILKSYRNRFFSELEINSKNTILKKRVYLSRSQKNRKYNQKQIIKLVENFNFEIVDPSELTLKEQIQLFFNAEIIIGPAGAAWANLIFCKPDTIGMIFRPHNNGENSSFPNLAKVSGVKLYELKYINPEKDWISYMLSDKEAYIDVNLLDKAIRNFIS
ncbi:glycosyltransferase family 61 protein [Psychroflexus salinarum]|uniref:Glycosyltransferase family 61 protein n=1 Tax=Psychroflexus salinarum TaxID=546024 RepID=A0ABW3GS33_9FLAO